jgi:hypothetical protein
LSQVDMILAALARQHKLTILTTDRDFEVLTDLRVENWVVCRGQPPAKEESNRGVLTRPFALQSLSYSLVLPSCAA